MRSGLLPALLSFSTLLSACVAIGGAPKGAEPEQSWEGRGFLTPAPIGRGEFIDVFSTEAECRAAVEAWMSRQVVGNPVTGTCEVRDGSD